MKRLYADGTRCLFSGAAENQSKEHVLVPYVSKSISLALVSLARRHRAPACHCCSFQVETCDMRDWTLEEQGIYYSPQ
jgi:hypothetical protein